MKRITNVEIAAAAHDEADHYLETVLDAVEEALEGTAHDAAVTLLMDEDYPGDDAYDALINRIRKVARRHLSAVITAGGK